MIIDLIVCCRWMYSTAEEMQSNPKPPKISPMKQEYHDIITDVCINTEII